MAERQRYRLLAVNDWAYRALLRVYPAAHRREYGPWMAQLFRDLCRDAVQRDGALGLIWLWVRTLLDTARTALVEHMDDRERVRGTRGSASAWESAMMDTTALDRQLGDLVYLLVKALRSGYSLRQTVAVMAETAPEPASSALQGWQADLAAGRTHEEALAKLRAAWASPYLAQIAETILQNLEGSGSLAAQIAPLADDIYRAVGSDEAFYPEMRRQAEHLGGPLPERVRLEQAG
jgi:hypothetical protein